MRHVLEPLLFSMAAISLEEEDDAVVASEASLDLLAAAASGKKHAEMENSGLN